MAKNLHFKFAPRNKQTAEKVTLLGISLVDKKRFISKEIKVSTITHTTIKQLQKLHFKKQNRIFG